MSWVTVHSVSSVNKDLKKTAKRKAGAASGQVSDSETPEDGSCEKVCRTKKITFIKKMPKGLLHSSVLRV